MPETGELPSTQNFLGFEKEDFTQYKVRGHYAKNAAMQRYFRGMMWYGRRNFLLSDKAQTLAAILLPHLVDAADALDQFDTIDQQVTSLIGQQDRYTLEGYRDRQREGLRRQGSGPEGTGRGSGCQTGSLPGDRLEGLAAAAHRHGADGIGIDAGPAPARKRGNAVPRPALRA